MGPESTYIEPPCQEMPYIDYKHSMIKTYYNATEYLLWFYYPHKTKFIAQSQDVDAHSLIGNIGGYIGLFLGKFLSILRISQKTSPYALNSEGYFVVSVFLFQCCRLCRYTITGTCDVHLSISKLAK